MSRRARQTDTRLVFAACEKGDNDSRDDFMVSKQHDQMSDCRATRSGRQWWRDVTTNRKYNLLK